MRFKYKTRLDLYKPNSECGADCAENSAMQSATFCREKARVSSAAALRRKLLLPPKERRASKEATCNSPDLRCGLNRCCPPDCELLPMQLLSAVELCSCSSAETPPHATAGLDAASVPSSSFKPRKSRVFSTSWNTSSARPITLAAQQRITEKNQRLLFT